MKSNSFILIYVLLGTVFTQLVSAEYYFYVQFSDKNNSPYSLSTPGEYLSSRSLARRAAFQIVPDSADLPVNPDYVEQVRQTGVSIHSRSKWLNGITLLTADSSKMNLVRALPFVRFVQFTGLKGQAATAPQRTKGEPQTDDYGLALEQLQQLNGQFLHLKNATGKGILIGVLDAGYKNVDVNPAFADMRTSGRIVGNISIVDPAINVYNEDSHGAAVLSVMGGYLPANYKGTAPDASFLLIQTEYVPTEYLSEVDFWVRGIEFADSVGVDVINSSLGYTTFDDPTMNFRYVDMNGRVSRASIAAEIAGAKGILVCNSAGNDGNKAWKYIGSPADARNILTVGSVDKTGLPSTFTSLGPTFDQRVKPEVAARGSSTVLVNTAGTVSTANGTSFSSPVMAGLMASYLQLLRDQQVVISVEQIIHRILATANSINSPTPQLGYGIPDFSRLPEMIPALSVEAPSNSENLRIFLNLSEKQVFLEATTPIQSILIVDIAGNQLVKTDILNNFATIDLSGFPQGIYLIYIQTSTGNYTRKLSL
ncbi:MAG: S8 family peptidase [Paludibacter sp.]|jgi:hypothetical protein|nr:S8 family peptidase [Paludibacter sp.]